VSEDEPKSPKPRVFLPPPGFFSCKRRVEILKRYQNLIRHRERWAPEMEFTTPIEKDIPDIKPTTDPYHRMMLIEREISRLVVPVHHMLNQVGICTAVVRTPLDPLAPADDAKPSRSYDIIADYFHLQSIGTGQQRNFELLMRMLEQGIGAYQMRQERAFRDLFNPLFWVAMVVRSPIWVLERAGVAHDEQMRTLIVGIYGRLIYSLIIILLGLAIVRQGILTWKDVVPLILKHFAP